VNDGVDERSRKKVVVSAMRRRNVEVGDDVIRRAIFFHSPFGVRFQDGVVYRSENTFHSIIT